MQEKETVYRKHTIETGQTSSISSSEKQNFLIVKLLSRLELQHVLKRTHYHHKKGFVWLVFKILIERKKYIRKARAS